jgi:hypothetical protein
MHRDMVQPSIDELSEDELSELERVWRSRTPVIDVASPGLESLKAKGWLSARRVGAAWDYSIVVDRLVTVAKRWPYR